MVTTGACLLQCTDLGFNESRVQGYYDIEVKIMVCESLHSMKYSDNIQHLCTASFYSTQQPATSCSVGFWMLLLITSMKGLLETYSGET